MLPVLFRALQTAPSLAHHYLHLEITALKNGNKTISSIQKYFYSLVIEEDITRVSSDIASCGPAFFSYLLQCFINAAVDKTNITHEEATTLVSEMVVGMGKLLEKGIFTLPTLQEKYALKAALQEKVFVF